MDDVIGGVDSGGGVSVRDVFEIVDESGFGSGDVKASTVALG